MGTFGSIQLKIRKEKQTNAFKYKMPNILYGSNQFNIHRIEPQIEIKHHLDLQREELGHLTLL